MLGYLPGTFQYYKHHGTSNVTFCLSTQLTKMSHILISQSGYVYVVHMKEMRLDR